MTSVPDITRLLQEISTAESEVEISAILERHAQILDALPPRTREQTNEILRDAIHARHEAWSTRAFLR
jgi:hypothetical protein